MKEKHYFNKYLIQDLEKLGYKKVVNEHGVVIYRRNDEDGFVINILSDKEKLYVITSKKHKEDSNLVVKIAFENTNKFKLSLIKIKYAIGASKVEIEAELEKMSV